MIKLLTSTPLEKWRAETLFTKEPGTVKWIQNTVKPGDVFYDIGANIGQYTLMAAQRGATVVAFEPHIFNAASLIRNVQKNNFGKVQLITSALHDAEGFLPFNYLHTMAGSSGSQLGHTTSERGEEFVPELVELKHTTTLDKLVLEDGVLPQPDIIKIDVDGNELAVLRGMEEVLYWDGLRSLQVEMHPVSGRQVLNYLEDNGWEEVSRHHTSFGQAEIDKGTDPAKVFCNVIYQRRAA